MNRLGPSILGARQAALAAVVAYEAAERAVDKAETLFLKASLGAGDHTRAAAAADLARAAEARDKALALARTATAAYSDAAYAPLEQLYGAGTRRDGDPLPAEIADFCDEAVKMAHRFKVKA